MTADDKPTDPHAVVEYRIKQIAPNDIVDRAGDIGRAIFSSVPALGSFIYLHDKDQARASAERLEHVLISLNDRMKALAKAGVQARSDSDFRELVLRVLPTVAKTRSEAKRERFADILANAAVRTPDDDDEAATMAILLDQLEPAHILLLDRIVVQSGGIPDDHDLLGSVLVVSIEKSGYNPAAESHLWGRLHSVGLLAGSDNPTMQVDVEPTPGTHFTAVYVTTLGLRFHAWITSPQL